MTDTTKKHRIRVGNTTLEIYQRTDPKKGTQYRFAYKLPGSDRWRHATHTTLKKAKDRATEIALKISQGTIAFEHLTPAQKALCTKLLTSNITETELDTALAWLKTQRNNTTLQATIKTYIQEQIATAKNQTKTPHIAQIERDLNNIAQHLGPTTPVNHITTAQLTAYITAQNVGPKRSNALRGTLTKYYTHLRNHRHIPNEHHTAAHLIPIINEHTDAEIILYTPEQTTTILQHTTAEFLPYFALLAFTGLRPEEISPKKATPKPPLTTAAIDLKNKTIWIARKNAKGKTPRPRAVPILPVAEAWIKHCQLHQGPERPICQRNASEAYETKRLGKILNTHHPDTNTHPDGTPRGWTKDALRHAYGSYRNALIKNLDQLSQEMGNSITILHRHYHEPQPTAIAKTHFNLTPKTVLNQP